MTEKQWVETWLIDFYDASKCENGIAVKNGQRVQPIETVEIERAYAPTRWARNHAFALKRTLQGAKVTFSITKC